MPKEPINEGFALIQEKGSRIIAEGIQMLPAASLMIAAGVLPNLAARRKPFVTIVNSYTNQIPGHAHLDVLGRILMEELKKKGFNVWYANVGGCVDDGIAMGHFGMKYSLASRELITDQIETIIGAHPPDALVGIGNCDKIVPGIFNAMVRLNIPSIYVSGGPMLAGVDNTDLITVFEGIGKHNAGNMNESELERLAESSCITCGSCAGMFTANSMNCLGEALGLALPGNGTIPAAKWIDDKYKKWELNDERIDLIRKIPDRVVYLLDTKTRPCDIITQQAIDNAFIADNGIGGSTNTVLHTIGVAYEAGVPYELKRINELSRTTANVCKVSPSRQEVHVEHVHQHGGIGTILKSIHQGGKSSLDLKARTLFGTLEDYVLNSPDPDGDVIRTVDKAFSQEGGLAILYGNIAPNGAVVKTAGVPEDMMRGEAKVKVYYSHEDALKAVLSNEVKDGDAVGILYEGPKGGPGMQEMLAITSAISGKGLRVLLFTDGRFSGGTRGPCIGHISPEAAARGPVAALRTGDVVGWDFRARRIEALLSEDEIQDRLRLLPEFKPKVTKGWLGRYSYLVTSADTGAVLRDPYKI